MTREESEQELMLRLFDLVGEVDPDVALMSAAITGDQERLQRALRTPGVNVNVRTGELINRHMDAIRADDVACGLLARSLCP